MALYTKDLLERVKDAVDMVELVGARTDLKRVGSKWSGLCRSGRRGPAADIDCRAWLTGQGGAG